MNQNNYRTFSETLKPGAKILFACFPADGHFNPLTGIAAHLKQQGFDVRWYTSVTYKAKIESLGIPFYPLQKAMDITGGNVETLFPERARCKSAVNKLNFDIIHIFLNRGPEYYEDLQAVHQSFPFDLLVADVAFTGIPFVSDLMEIPVIGVGVFPITQNSKDLAPNGLGMTPSYTVLGRARQALLRWAAKNILFAKSNRSMQELLGNYGIDTSAAESVFDLMPKKCRMVLQTGTPGFEYRRNDLSDNYKFVGPLLPYTAKKGGPHWYNDKLLQFKKIVLVTQGTVETDATKLLVPTLEALINTEYLVVVTTGGSHTEALRKQYQAPNVIIEDYIPFADIMPFADVYITNGGMGGVQLSIQNNLPMITAGVHEGKNEISARVGYFNLGINLKTERPKPQQLRRSVKQVTGNGMYRNNVKALAKEFGRYQTMELCEQYVRQALPKAIAVPAKRAVEEAIY